jgi:endo-1,4-beta-xylanase
MFSSLKRLFKNKWTPIGLITLVVIGLVLLLLCVSVALGSNNLSTPNGRTINLIDGQDWSHFAGASKTSSGIHITPLERAIVNQDGSGGQPNPAVNVRGPHLETKGDFRVDAAISSLPTSGPASITFYSQVPIIYDEWRYQPSQVELAVYQNRLIVSAWDGKSDNAIEQKKWNIVTSNNQAAVGFASSHGKTIILFNNQVMGALSTKDLFEGRQVWFGANAPSGSEGWAIRSLTAQALGKGSVQVQPGASLVVTKASADSLKNLAAANPRNIPIGAAVANYPLFSDRGYRDIVANQFSMLTPENEMKAQFIHPQPNTYSFTDADSLVDSAIANNMVVHGHNLIFSEANPKWMQTTPLNQRQAIFTDHIQTVVSHFGTKVNEWDVVDEPLNDNDKNNGDSSDLRQNIWFAAMGESYIDAAFTTAHAANPAATLYLNEYGLEAAGPRWDEFLSLVKRLQARNVPIDGVGFQAHVYEPGDEINQSTLENHMQVLAGMGLKSRISELDVYGDNSQHQADQYTAALNACLNQPSCTSVNIWGVTDKYGSTTELHNYPLSYGNDLIWDKNLKPKLAYNTLQKALQSH